MRIDRCEGAFYTVIGLFFQGAFQCSQAVNADTMIRYRQKRVG